MAMNTIVISGNMILRVMYGMRYKVIRVKKLKEAWRWLLMEKLISVQVVATFNTIHIYGSLTRPAQRQHGRAALPMMMLPITTILKRLFAATMLYHLPWAVKLILLEV